MRHVNLAWICIRDDLDARWEGDEAVNSTLGRGSILGAVQLCRETEDGRRCGENLGYSDAWGRSCIR
jgi:hypothetical protein